MQPDSGNNHNSIRRGWRERWRALLHRLRPFLPGTAVLRGASISMALMMWLFAVIMAYPAFVRFAWWSLPAYALGLALATALASAVGVLLLRWLARWPRLFVWGIATAVLLLLATFANGGQRALPLLMPLLLLLTGLVGAGVTVWWRQRQGETAVHPRLSALGLLLGVGGLLALGGWLLWPGAPLVMPPNAAMLAWEEKGKATSTLPDPAQTGPFTVQTLTYGSGTDRHRPEFGADVDVVTTSVNGDVFLSGWTKLRTAYWGFGETELPRNGRVWYPLGDGPFPLVLVVHGNHSMDEFSDPGYAYLGELLASRGFIVVSVDENFLNGSAVADWLGQEKLSEENDARGWLLLEHLRLWRAWQETAVSPFYHKIDMTRIALIGHSRGGEAVAVAAAFNRLPRYPDYATMRFNYDFDIRAVIAIAPVDGQYKPADVPLPLQDVHYLVLQGSHDMDVTTFMGQQQYDRVHFSGGDWFKAAVYVYGANHGQFNTVWGDTDRWTPGILLYNRGQLLPETEQQRAAQVFVTAFLEATLHETAVYRDFFRDYRPGAAWLPDTIYLTRYEDAHMQFVLTFEEDIDVTTTTLPGGRLGGRYLSVWREEDVEQKGTDLATHAVTLGWRERADGETAVYTITLPPTLTLHAEQALVFSLADAGPIAAADTPRPPIDLHIELEDGQGETAVLPLSHVAYLQPQLDAQLMKLAFLSRGATAEVVWQSFVLPLVDFTAVNPDAGCHPPGGGAFLV
ncbi:MAG: MFS transporter [Ardenticatenaceae bacterium]|nr:MFS transporter [Ardenticatenaceae bacterium]